MSQGKNVLKSTGVFAIATLAAVAATARDASASAFAPGNVVVYRVGNGTTTLSDGGNAVFIDEYTPAGDLVQSVPMPTSGNGALTAGTNTPEGTLSISTDGRYVMVPGYRKNVGVDNVDPGSVVASTIPRVIGRVPIDGSAADTSLALKFNGSASARVWRSVASTDGSEFWVSHGGGNSTTGIAYATVNGITTNDGYSDAVSNGNTRQVNIFGGDVYFSTSSTNGGLPSRGIYRFSGQPHLSATPTLIAATTASTHFAQGFALFDESDAVADMDTLYFVDLDNDGGVNNGYVRKFSSVGGSWVLTGSSPALPNLLNLAGIETADGIVTLYGTTQNATGGQLLSITDSSGYNAMFSPAAAWASLETAGANQLFRGVAVIPLPEPSSAIFLLGLAGIAALRRRRA